MKSNYGHVKTDENVSVFSRPVMLLGLDMGKEIKGGKKKRGNFGENITFDGTRSYSTISKTQFNTISTLTTLFYCFMGMKIIDIKMRCDASRGRKSKAGGKEKNDERLNNIHPWFLFFTQVINHD